MSIKAGFAQRRRDVETMPAGKGRPHDDEGHQGMTA
jgi:hypothetical protein